MIVMLLSSSKSLLAQSNTTNPSTGSELQSDTINVIIPLYYIKQANAKMIERNYLIDITKQKDSIIILKDEYIAEQKNIISDFQSRLDSANNINININKELETETHKNKIITYGAAAIIGGLIIGLIVK